MSRHFYVWCPDYGQQEHDASALTVVGNGGPREAACEWAQYDDSSSADYSILKRGGTLVMVRDKDSGEVSAWIVEGEAIPHYSARPAAKPAESLKGFPPHPNDSRGDVL